MEIDVAKLKQILSTGAGASCGQFDLYGRPAVVAVLLNMRHLQEAIAWVEDIEKRHDANLAPALGGTP
jgi:hypothetical protein